MNKYPKIPVACSPNLELNARNNFLYLIQGFHNETEAKLTHAWPIEDITHSGGGGGWGGAARGNRCTLTNVQNWEMAGRGEEVWQVLAGVFILLILLSFSQHVFTAVLLHPASLTLP